MKFKFLLLPIALLIAEMAQAQCETGSAQATVSGYNNMNGGLYQFCLANEVTFSAAGSAAPVGDAITNYNWSYGNGIAIDTTAATISYTYPQGNMYNVILEINTAMGCSLYDTLTIVINVEPTFVLTDSLVVCMNEDAWLYGQVASEELNNAPSFNNNNLTQLPDVANVSSEIIISAFPDISITTCDQLDMILLNMEHSYLNDLIIDLTCPNGTTVVLHNQGGGGTFLGTPVDDTNGNPGEGSDYYWSADAPSTLAAYAAANANAPSGTYLPVDNLCDFIGCPVNGTWTFNFQDMAGADDGFLFNAALGFSFASSQDYLSYTQSFGAGADSTYWVGDGIINWNAGMDSIQVNTEFTGTYNFTYTAVGSGGCTYTAQASVVVDVNPPSPIVIQNGQGLLCTSGATYQWYFNNQPIAGANEQDYNPTESGSYSVEVSNQTGCSTLSSPFNYVYDMVGEWTSEKVLQTFPNPFDNTINVKINMHGSIEATLLQVIDVLGKIQIEKQITNANQTLTLKTDHLAEGIYFIKLVGNNQALQTQKIVKR
jgi:subtilisin-like proprotein convertase family protein